MNNTHGGTGAVILTAFRLDANGNQIIFVNGYLGKIASDPLYKNIPFSDLLGAEVTFIDEQPALEELMEYAKLYGYISKGTYPFPPPGNSSHSTRWVHTSVL